MLAASAALRTDMKKGMKGEIGQLKGKQREREKGRACRFVFRHTRERRNPAFQRTIRPKEKCESYYMQNENSCTPTQNISRPFGCILLFKHNGDEYFSLAIVFLIDELSAIQNIFWITTVNMTVSLLSQPMFSSSSGKLF